MARGWLVELAGQPLVSRTQCEPGLITQAAAVQSAGGCWLMLPRVGRSGKEASVGDIAETRLQRFDALAREMRMLIADSHEKGMQWQADFKLLAEQRALSWEKGEGRGDCKVNGLTVQCKHIDRAVSGRLDIANMRPVAANGGHRGYLVGEYDVLALRHHKQVYIIPAQYLDGGDGTLRSRVGLAEIQTFRDAWDVFANGYTPQRRASQMQFDLGGDDTDGV